MVFKKGERKEKSRNKKNFFFFFPPFLFPGFLRFFLLTLFHLLFAILLIGDAWLISSGI